MTGSFTLATTSGVTVSAAAFSSATATSGLPIGGCPSGVTAAPPTCFHSFTGSLPLPMNQLIMLVESCCQSSPGFASFCQARGQARFWLLNRRLGARGVAFAQQLPLLLPVVEFAAVTGGDHSAHEPLPAEVDLRVPGVAIGALTLRREVLGVIEPVKRTR